MFWTSSLMCHPEAAELAAFQDVLSDVLGPAPLALDVPAFAGGFLGELLDAARGVLLPLLVVPLSNPPPSSPQ